MKIPKIIIYGQESNSLSYIPVLLKNNVNVKEVSNNNHFIFYHNPEEYIISLVDLYMIFINYFNNYQMINMAESNIFFTVILNSLKKIID